MIDPSSKLTVLHDDNSSFVDLSQDSSDLTRDNFNLQLVSAEDYLYIGYTKPFGYAFIELFTANTNANEMSAEIYDGTSWVSVELNDEGKGMTRSGFLTWDKSSMKAESVNSNEKFYLRLKPSADHSLASVRGINLVFADDASLKQEFMEIDNSNLLPPGEVSHIGTHVASRNFILHHLRNHYSKVTNPDNITSVLKKINQFDLIDVFEIREASTFLALSKIFFNLSDSPDDHWWLKYREYGDKFEEKMVVARLSIDLDNDGLDDAEEVQRQYNPTRWSR